MSVQLLSEDEIQKETSEKLLAGWAMLNELCPISNFPLLSKDGVVWSVPCQMRVVVQKAGDAPLPKQAAQNPNEAQPPVDYSKRLGEKLLAGWTMLEEECPFGGECPLMQDPKTKKKWSVFVNDFVEDYRARQDASPSELKPAETSVTPQQDPTRPPRQDPPQSNTSKPTTERAPQTTTTTTAKATHPPIPPSNQISKAISTKLLSGWRMMEEECPITHACPLMEDPKTKKRWSAALGVFIEDYENQQAKQAMEMGKTDPSPSRKQPDTSGKQAHPPTMQPPPPTMRQQPNEPASSEQFSQRMSEKLLKGWKMLEEECPVTHKCPLMQDPKTNKLWSAALNDFLDNQLPSDQPKQSSDQPAQAPRQQARVQDYSKAISKLLLSGWKMLEDECPVTHQCPLMEDPKTKKRWSVALAEFVEDYQDKRRQATSPPESQRQAQAAQLVESSPSLARQSQPRDNHDAFASLKQTISQQLNNASVSIAACDISSEAGRVELKALFGIVSDAVDLLEKLQ